MRWEELEAMTTGELLALIEAAREVIAEREHESEGAPSRKVVERRRAGAGRWLQNEKTGRYTSRYEGKTLRPELAEEFGLPPGSTAVRESAEDQEAADRHRDP